MGLREGMAPFLRGVRMVNIGRMGIFQKERRGMTVWPYFPTRREICILSLNLSEIPEVRY